ncbi:FecCD family ABC transporter permease [Thermus tengchongensis]|uniref:Iron ABC transporter permease n=2 Tax=Thermus tengchongensis TaxID=1214928 RepID=A0A4Y9F975_9DEIN|nr:iron ABC transporter permease [Thermus tengchongensis]TFU25130.1 iron ABC transporter permease [Thermus tengchongensis]
MTQALPLALRRSLVLLWLVFLLLVALVLGVALGTVSLSPLEVVQALLGQRENPIVTEMRLPRVLGGMLVGAALGVAGAAFQGLFRNPLADPYLMGSAAGAAFAVTLLASFLGSLAPGFAQHAVFQSLPPSATLFGFLGAFSATLLTLVLAGGAARTGELVLAGVVVGSVLTGATTYLMLQDADRVRAVFAYTLGNLAFLGWPGVKVLLLFFLLALPPLLLLGRVLNALQLGEEVAKSLGLPLEGLKLFLLLTASLLVAAAVAQAGIIGFVGLITPHLLRRFLGEDYRLLLPASALGGAVLLALADLLARTLTRPAELPVGVVTTLLGGPFFLYLMWRRRGRA